MSDKLTNQISQCWLDYIKEHNLSNEPIDYYILARKDFYLYVEQQYGIKLMPYFFSTTYNKINKNYHVIDQNKKLLFDIKYPSLQN